MPQANLEALVAGAISGRLVSFPTDTVPALAALPEKSELIFAAKQRKEDKPLILMGANAESLWPFVTGTKAELEIWQQVAQLYWPGALTLVLPASDRVPPAMHPLDPTTIGVRVPNSPIAQKILAQTQPLATTSANRSGEPPIIGMAEIAAQFPETLVLSEEATAAGVPSTVAKWNSGNWQILRQGAVKLEI